MAIYLCFLFASAAEVFKKAIKSLICDGRDRARMDGHMEGLFIEAIYKFKEH